MSLDYECICMFCVGENQHYGRDLWGICRGGPDRCSKNGQVKQSHQSQNLFFVIQRDERRGLGRDLRQVCLLTHFFLFLLSWYKKSMILSDTFLFSLLQRVLVTWPVFSPFSQVIDLGPHIWNNRKTPGHLYVSHRPAVREHHYLWETKSKENVMIVITPDLLD